MNGDLYKSTSTAYQHGQHGSDIATDADTAYTNDTDGYNAIYIKTACTITALTGSNMNGYTGTEWEHGDWIFGDIQSVTFDTANAAKLYKNRSGSKQ